MMNVKNKKSTYRRPELELIPLDKEISLTMASAPGDPEGNWGTHLEQAKPGPFKEHLA
jgi:hypothetical protein